MEIILVFVGFLILAAFTFLLIEFPYYLVSIFVFLHLYNFNLEMPGPLDLRGLISVILVLRLVIFDKQNLDLIKESLSNKFFILIILFSLYSAFIDFDSGYSLFITLKLFILNVVALLLGFLTVLRGYAKRTIVLAILVTGVFAFGDLVYAYAIEGSLLIKRIIDVIISGGTYWESMNHNFFGGLCGYALITVFLLFITKKIDKVIFFVLSIIFILGIIISTSRMTFLSLTITIVLILITQQGLNINVKKVLISIFATIILFVIVTFSYSYILSAMNIKSEFADKIYFRLVEEPLSFFNEDSQKFGWDNNRVQGSMRWRMYKTLRDADLFFDQKISTILFGFGRGGYKKIGEIQFVGTESLQYSAHNFYTNLIAEIGLFGLFLFFAFFLSLLHSTLKMIKKGIIHFSLVYLLLYMLIYTFGGDASLTEKFGYILYGGIIAELILASNQNQKSETQN